MTTSINFTEFFKLASKLATAEIPFQVFERKEFNGYQLYYPNTNNWKCSVILHSGSYGHKSGLLEIMGLLTAEEAELDSVLGYLTAEEVFERIHADYNN